MELKSHKRSLEQFSDIAVCNDFNFAKNIDDKEVLFDDLDSFFFEEED